MTMNPYYINDSDSDTGSDTGTNRQIIFDDSESESESTVISDDIYSLDSMDIDICEQICHEESAHFYGDRFDKHYYLGTCCRPQNADYWMMSSSISTANFYQYRMVDILHYLWLYSIVRSSRSQFEIMQLHTDNEFGTYKVVLKTFWIRIVQRTWKRIYWERKEIWRKRMSLNALRHREIRGTFPDGIRTLPSMVGMMH